MLFWGFLFAGFAAGIFFINLWGNIYLDGGELYGPEQMRSIAALETEPEALFRYLCIERGKGILLLWLLGYTVAGIPVVMLVLAGLGAGAGVLLCSCLIQMRFAGIILFLTAVLPQWFLYGAMIWILCGKIYERGILRYKKERCFDDWNREKKYLSTLLLTMTLLAAGAALETFVNPWLVRQTINFL